MPQGRPTPGPVQDEHVAELGLGLIPLLFLQDGQGAVGLQNGVLDGLEIEHVLRAQMVAQIRHRVVGQPQNPFLQDPLPDQQQGRSAHEGAEPAEAEAEPGHGLLDQIQRQDGHDAVEQGDVGVRDGRGGKVRDGQGDDEVEGL